MNTIPEKINPDQAVQNAVKQMVLDIMSNPEYSLDSLLKFADDENNVSITDLGMIDSTARLTMKKLSEFFTNSKFISLFFNDVVREAHKEQMQIFHTRSDNHAQQENRINKLS